MAISMLKIRRPLGRLIFDMGIAIPGKTVFLIETVITRALADPVSYLTHKCFKKILSSNVKSRGNSLCSRFLFNRSIQSKVCTRHGISTIMTCAKLWLDLIIIFHSREICIFLNIIWNMATKTFYEIGYRPQSNCDQSIPRYFLLPKDI